MSKDLLEQHLHLCKSFIMCMSNYLLKEVSEISYFPSDNHVRQKNAHFFKNTQFMSGYKIGWDKIITKGWKVLINQYDFQHTHVHWSWYEQTICIIWSISESKLNYHAKKMEMKMPCLNMDNRICTTALTFQPKRKRKVEWLKKQHGEGW